MKRWIIFSLGTVFFGLFPVPNWHWPEGREKGQKTPSPWHKKTRSFCSWLSFHIPSKPHTEIHFFHPIFFYPDCLFWKFCSLRSQNNQRTRLCLRLRLANRQVLLAWLSLRPISISQLHALLHFHLWPIYLVVFKGSYYLRRDISSWGGLHA